MSDQSEVIHEPLAEPGHFDPAARQVVVRFGIMGNLGIFSHRLENLPVAGQMLVLATTRGTEMGKTLVNLADEPAPFCITPDKLELFIRDSGPEYPIARSGHVIRAANTQDLNDQAHLDRSAHEEGCYCRQQIHQLGLDMRMVAVEHLLGGERIIFYFTAENRVDFRELVRLIATQFHTRIEMRQVGARDEARIVGDYERCGRRCCCQEYLKLLKPVSMRMAKCQKATLDPAKISGRCGRLMCCLRYEDATYDQLQANLPRRNLWVRTKDDVVGKVIDSQILTQLVRLYLMNGTQVVVPNDDIVERNVAEPPRPPEREVRERPVRAAPHKLWDEVAPPAPRPAAIDAAGEPGDQSTEGIAFEQAGAAEGDEESAPEAILPDGTAQVTGETGGSNRQTPSQGQERRGPRRRRGGRGRRGGQNAAGDAQNARPNEAPRQAQPPRPQASPQGNQGPAGEAGQGGDQPRRRRHRGRRRGHGGGNAGDGDQGNAGGGDFTPPAQ